MREGKERGTTALVFPPTRSGGDIYHAHDDRLESHLGASRNTAFMRTTSRPCWPRPRSAVSTNSKLGTSDAGDRRTCYLPESVKLEWKQDIQGQRDQLALDVLLQDVKVNQFEPSKAAALFVEPVIRVTNV